MSISKRGLMRNIATRELRNGGGKSYEVGIHRGGIKIFGGTFHDRERAIKARDNLEAAHPKTPQATRPTEPSKSTMALALGAW